MFGTGIVTIKLLPIMKLIFSAIFLLLTDSVFCQQISLEVGPSNRFANNKWDLSKYIWSQTHAVTQTVNKPPLDYNAIDSWDYLDDLKLALSPNGNYFAYGTYKGDKWLHRDEILTIQSISGDWKKAFATKDNGLFSSDNKQYIFQNGDVLNFVQLGTDQIRSVTHVKSFKQTTNGTAEWIVYQMNNSETDLVLQNLTSGKETKIDNVAGFDFDESGKWLACQLKNDQKEFLLLNLVSGEEKRLANVESNIFSNNGESILLKMAANDKVELKYLNLLDGAAKTIWSATGNDVQISNYSLDQYGMQVVFTVKSLASAQGEQKKENNSIWYYRAGMNKAVLKVDNRSKGIEEGLRIQEVVSFTGDGKYIQFELEKAHISFTPASDAIMVDVWNHKDNFLQSKQALTKPKSISYKVVTDTETDKIIRIERENETLSFINGDYAIIQQIGRSFVTDRFWESKEKRDSVWLMSLKKGTRELLLTTNDVGKSVYFSPQGKYLLYIDLVNGGHYYSLDLATGKKVKISNGIPDWKLGHRDEFSLPYGKPEDNCGIAGWIKGDKAVLAYDDYDIWQLDPTGKMMPVCITNEYGRKNKVSLSLLNNDRLYGNASLIIQPNDTLLLAAFNATNKNSGFYRKVLRVQGDPELLNMGHFFYSNLTWLVDLGYSYGMKPVRAGQANTWIVRRESATEAPNYFLTSDFKSFQPLTNFQPQTNYNWLKSELHSFKQLDGTISQGILYKPENFDPLKKYPVVISFYTQISGALHQFPDAKYIECAHIIRNQAWMVSQEYLVFFPDIYFNKGQWGPSVVNSVVGAVHYLSALPYVDSKHIGACGHSNGGRFGYYLFTHSNCFAAMSVGSGTTNIISNGLKMENIGIFGDGKSSMDWAENGMPNGGIGELWKNKASWIDHASVLQADKATCPLLIFQNKKDPAYLQGFEMFTSLRRLKKPNWWLEYDKGGHTLNSFGGNINELKDYTIRYTQFWDHFLKRAPAPSWMTNGIPYKLKGIESRLELDPSSNCGFSDKPCIICEAWNRQYKRNPAMFERPVSEWKLDSDIEKEMGQAEMVNYKQNMKEEDKRKQLNNRKYMR